MTGTGVEAQAELWQIYRLPVIPIPTHRACRRTVMPERVFGSTAAKWDAIVDEIRRIHESGRPGADRDAQRGGQRISEPSVVGPRPRTPGAECRSP